MVIRAMSKVMQTKTGDRIMCVWRGSGVGGSLALHPKYQHVTWSRAEAQ